MSHQRVETMDGTGRELAGGQVDAAPANRRAADALGGDRPAEAALHPQQTRGQTAPPTRPGPSNSYPARGSVGTDSGLSALAFVAGHYQIGADALQLIHDAGLGEKPSGTDDIIRMGRRLGLKARLQANQPSRRLNTIPLPAILHLKDGTFAVAALRFQTADCDSPTRRAGHSRTARSRRSPRSGPAKSSSSRAASAVRAPTLPASVSAGSSPRSGATAGRLPTCWWRRCSCSCSRW